LQRTALILFIIPFITGCAILKKETTEQAGEIKNSVSYEQIRALNITNNDFNIIKAEINIIIGNEREKMLGNIKYKEPETYLISIRNHTGIEGARILITSDSILVNDRINKKLYYGSTDYLNKKYGITIGLLPIITGDLIIDDNDSTVMECIKNAANINTDIGGKKIHYKIDCGKTKVTSVNIEDEITGKKLKIEFKKFEKDESCQIAKKITIKSNEENERIEINIEKCELGLENDITFIPGKKYEKILLK